MTNLFGLTGIVILILVLATLSEQDQTIEIENQHYVDMVCTGAWPDFENIQPICP